MKQPATLPTLRRQGAALTVLALAVVLAALAGLCFGSQGYTPLQLWQAWCSGDPQNAVYRVLLHVRWPRTLAGLLAGSALAAAGVLLQAVLNNAMASPNVIGVNAGAGLAALCAAALWPTHPNAVQPAAFAGALAAALLDLGYDINTTDEAQIQEAYELLADAKSKGVYQSFVMDEVFGKMEGSNAAIAMYYAGDYLTMLDNNPDLKFVVPKEGSNWFVDAMCVLKTAQHKEEAEAWINFIASTESNLANMDYIGYASPNLEALEGYPAYYEETYGEPLDEERYEIMAAPDEVLARCELYTNLPADTLTLYNDLWTELGI